MSDHWDTIEDALKFWRSGEMFDEERMHIDAALAFVREMKAQPPVPVEVTDAIGYCWRWALTYAERHVDSEERYLFMDEEINKVVMWLDALPKQGDSHE